MRVLVKATSFLGNLLTLWALELDLDEDIRSHLDMLTDQNIRMRMSRDDAQRAARIELGVSNK
jgi:hypothetical protein